jgi:hypothetical protein
MTEEFRFGGTEENEDDIWGDAIKELPEGPKEPTQRIAEDMSVTLDGAIPTGEMAARPSVEFNSGEKNK